MTDKTIPITAGMFILIALVGTTYYISNPETTGDCYSQVSGTGTNDVKTIPVNCLYRLNKNDNLSISYDDEANPVSAITVYKLEVNAVRVGN